jgi:adenylate cyclase
MSGPFKAATAALVTGVLGLAMILFPAGMSLEEDIGLHLLFKIRGLREVPSDVLVITLDKMSAQFLDLPSDPIKWPRNLHARLIDRLVEKNVSVIAFDMIFSEPRIPEHDDLFAKSIRNAGNVVLCEYIKKEKVPLTGFAGNQSGLVNIESIVPPIPALARSAFASAPFPLPKVPVKVNSYWAFKTGAGETPTLPIVAFQMYALPVYAEFIDLMRAVSPFCAEKLPKSADEIIKNKEIKKLIRVLRDIFNQEPNIAEKMLARLKASKVLSDNPEKFRTLSSLIHLYQGTDSRYLNFYGPPGTVVTVPYYQILQDRQKSSAGSKQLDIEGKVVFVGLSEQLRPEQKDGFYTVFSQPSGFDLSGVEIAATAFANILEDTAAQPLKLPWMLVIIIVWGSALGILCMYSKAIVAACSIIFLSLLYLVFAAYQFKLSGFWYPIVIPLFIQVPLAFFGTALWNYFDVSKERQNIKDAFGKFLPQDVVDQLAKSMADVETTSQRVYGTCMITDADNYTALAEREDPEELSNFMNKYYEVLFKPVRDNSGIISDVKGDSMLAIWATPRPDIDTKNLACRAAIDIIQSVNQFNRSNQKLRLPTRIGMHSGFISIGNIGAIDHYEYRPVGDIVNTASRMERLNKRLGTRILASKQVLHQLSGFLTRKLGRFLFAGKSKPVAVYELICLREESRRPQKKLCALFTQALDAYERQSWDEAIDLFNQTVSVNVKDGPSLFYLKKVQHYRDNPPDEKWNGIVCLNNK